MSKPLNTEHKLRAIQQERDRVAKEVLRRESALCRDLPKLFEDDVNARKKEIEAFRKELAKLERRLGRYSKPTKVDPQLVMLK